MNKHHQKWLQMFEALKEITAQNSGDPNIPAIHPTHGRWLSNQRTAYKAGKLAPGRIQALEALGVKWEINYSWDEIFESLKIVTAQNGNNPNIHRLHPTHGRWLNTQRSAYQAGKLAPSRIRALEALGVKWESREENWDVMFEGLKVIVTQNNGDPNVPFRHHTHGIWLNTQRMAYKTGKLAKSRIQALEVLGVKWEPREDIWDVMFEGLKVIAAQNNGDPNVPQKHPTHGPWLNNQRSAYQAGNLDQSRIQTLEALGVKWKMR